MNTGSAGIALIKRWEGLRLEAYKDPVGIWTIGYGHTKGVTPGMVITQAQAEQMLRNELFEYEGYVKQYVKAPINQSQFDSLVSFTYNLGPGNLANSTLLKKVNANPSDPTIYDEFVKWNKAGGEVLTGLTKRRIEEAELYRFGQKKKFLIILSVLIAISLLVLWLWTQKKIKLPF
jgi:lysozyme